ncbi:MAG TPA: hypothetical protein VFZ26_02010 [Gemmatimonadales bacterium]
MRRLMDRISLARRRWFRTGLLLTMAGGPATAQAQTVSPPIAEYQERARSSFQLSNESIFPLTVVLEVRGFNVTEQGEVVDAPFDSSRVHVKLSAMSFRIPPRGSYTVFYEARADSLPAWFNILSAISGARTDAGLNVRILLPHVVYLNQKTPLRKEQVAIRRFVFDSARGKLRVQLENIGPNLGRVLQVSAGHGKTLSPAGPAFPLFPGMIRWTELEWAADSVPDRLMVKFAKFTIDTALAPTLVASADSAAGTPPP